MRVDLDQMLKYIATNCTTPSRYEIPGSAAMMSFVPDARGGMIPEMLATVSATVGYLPLTAVFLVVLIAAHSRLRPQGSLKTTGSEDSGSCSIPPSVSSTIPVVGHLVSYVRNGPSYFSKLW